eukprot:4561183-Prymnesium_polylepis.1
MTKEQKLLVAHASVEVRLAKLAWSNKLKEARDERESLAAEVQEFSATLARQLRKVGVASAKAGALADTKEPEANTGAGVEEEEANIDMVRSAMHASREA